MKTNNAKHMKNTAIPPQGVPRWIFSSNCIRLSMGQWIIVTVICLAVFYFIPVLWGQIEKFSPGPDYRIPYELGNDYWHYERYCRTACSRNETLVVGDSVIWGHFVSRDNTLSGHLNKITGGIKFTNLGLDGIHPAAMEGLLRYYGRKITNKNVILHFNPLWISSPKQDLQTEKEFIFNHPKLVAQFTPKIPCYKASFSSRISAVLRRYMTLPNWISHINITYFQSMDMPTWTLENPYRNPLKAVTFELPGTDYYEGSENPDKSQKGAGIPPGAPGTDGFQWITPETSLQWSCFRRSIQMLKERGNRVFVLVGPFNEHMLEGASLEAYQRLKGQIELLLRQENFDYYMPPTLPAGLYHDASHPTSEGYALLAQQLRANESFSSYILNSGRD